ncbi:DUF1972 domain-containing protein [Paenibacillus sp. sptzw28]|uniref:DUF1972 domain-containing protein n=1 Tax=Paenibacillus sp. sptzw28 TaxID=715179 RepID=UPI001C6E1F6F|nr:DUF1972 domain-containing protein [Paenibacillus sp. sptzw28]QYR20624.1 DUF1972 domain-containing protein [Paenibacillus sp. sptzw28]
MNDHVKSVAFCGTRGLPANYGGFETAVDQITKELVDNNIDCHVFCRDNNKNEANPQTHEGRKLVYIQGSSSRKLDTFVSSYNTGIHLLRNRKKYDFVFWFNNANLPGILLTLIAGIPMAVNTDGLEWRRGKWSWPFKLYYFLSSLIISLFCRTLVSDSISIQQYYKKVFMKKTHFIPYGAPEPRNIPPEKKDRILQQFGVEPNKYFLQITRFEPDNLPYEIAVSFGQSELWKKGYKLVIIGFKDETPYAMQIKSLSGSSGVEIFPANYDQDVLAALREGAYCYMHGNSVGGTNPALLEAMQTCKRIFAIEGPFSSEVLGDYGKQFTIDKLAAQFHESISLENQSDGMKQRLKARYNWDAVAASYYNLVYSRPADYRGTIEGEAEAKANAEPLVGVILVNFNGADDTIECITSLMKMNYFNMNLYVVDNCSYNDSGLQLKQFIDKQDSSSIKFIQLERNVGFSGGNNVAIRQAMADGAELLWLINNDTIVDRDALSYLVETMKENPGTGIVGSKIYFYGTKRIWFAGGAINKLGMSSHSGYNKEDLQGELYSEVKEVGYITGCSLLANKKMIEQIGVLDEDFFLYYEDTEFCRRAIRYGWKVFYEPRSIVWHKVSASTKSSFNDHSPALDYYDIRNSIFFIRKCYSPVNRLIPYVGVCIKFLKKHVRLVVRPESKKLEKLKIIYRGLNDAIVNKHGSL